MGPNLLNQGYSILLDNLFVVVWLVLATILGLDFHARFVKIDKGTDSVNLANRYMWLTRRRKNASK